MKKPDTRRQFRRFIRPSAILLLFIMEVFPSEEFPEPDIIKNNVTFWKLIYSGVSTQEGLLHDRDYPLIIYEKVNLKGKSEKDRTVYIDSIRKSYGEMLVLMRSTTDTQSTGQQKKISALFAANAPPTALDSAETRIRFQIGQKERFRSGLERSSQYLDTITAILRIQGLPEKLKYLPHVESSFDPEAYSRVGAAGLWQFMRGTGKIFLKVTYDIDERLDPVKSTEAAARLLKLNYEYLQAWPLAVTAYNHGLGGMRKAVVSTGSNDIAIILKKHESPSFKFASKNFYASFLAAAQLADSTEYYFTELMPQSPTVASTYTVQSGITPAALCKQIGVSLDRFKRLNPAIRPVVYAQQKKIPVGYVVKIPVKTDTSAVAPPPVLSHAQSVLIDSWRTDYYTIRKGDNITNIARRYGVALQELVSLNSIKKSNHIYVGQVLRLPPKSAKSVVALNAAEMKPLKTQQTRGKTALSGTIQKVLEEEIYSDELVLPDARLKADGKLAADSGYSEPAMARSENSIVSNGGKKTKFTYDTGFDANIYTLGLEISPGASSVTIRVGFDESIERYAEWLNVTASDIIRFNELASTRLKVGQVLSLPLNTGSDLKKFEMNRLEYHMAIEEDFYSRFRITESPKWVIAQEETLSKRIMAEQIPFWLLKKFNRSVDFSTLAPGSTLHVPKIVSRSVHEPPMIISPENDTSLVVPPVMDGEVERKK